MRIRSFTLFAVIALVVAACGGEGAGETTTTGPSVDAMQLSYSLESGTSYEYEVDLNQTIDMTSSGDTSSLGEGEQLPAEMSLELNGTSVFTQAVSDGPEPDTYEVTITGDFSDIELSGTIDGEPVDSSEIPEMPDMAEMGPVDVTVVVDEQGNVIPEDGSSLGPDLLGGLGGLDMLGQLGAGGGPGQFIGPPLTEDEVTVGDSWSETVEVPALPDDDPITTQIDSEVVGADTVDDNEVFVIETTTTTSPIEFDLGELLAGFMSSFVPEDASEEEMAEVEEMVDQLRMAFTIDETVGNLTTWFDYEAGVAREAEFDNTTHLVMDVNIPDETTGELVEFSLDMTIGQDVTYRLTDSGSD